jgi:galactokinase/mevalonate kinase-like predicted kinase
MKYNGIICFVYQKEKEEVYQSIGDKFPIIFSENFDDSKNINPKNYYIVVSLKMAEQNIEKFKHMLIKYQKNNYPILHDNDGKFSNEILDIFWEMKIPYHNFTTSSIIENIIKMVDNH